MPREPPNCNSLRVQRASRLNHIEEGRLENHVHLMTKEFRRSSRLANQDMRIINLTLEFIQNSSGHSVEGRPPSHREKAKSRKLAPCFMYGERVISRKYRRTQSAVPKRRASTATTVSTVSEGGDDGEGDEELENVGSSRVRPQSSPMRRLGRPMSGVRRAESAQGLRHISDSLSDLSIQSLESDEEALEPDTLVEKHAPAEKQTDGSDPNPSQNNAPNLKPKQTEHRTHSPRPTKRPARSKSAHPASRTTPTFLTQPPSSAGSSAAPSRSSSAHPSRPASSIPSRPASAAPSRASSAATSRSRPSTAYSYGRIQNARILPPEMEILQRVVHLPPTSKIRQEKVMEYKKGLNKNCSQDVDKRFQDFLKSLPQKQANE